MMRLLAPALVLLAGPALADLVGFQTPSGNIHCLGSDGLPADGAPFVDCEVIERDGPPPLPRPADCEGEWGARFSVAGSGPGFMVCASDTVRDEASPVLPYGASVALGAVTCLSTEAGLECRNPEGHGFALARRERQLF